MAETAEGSEVRGIHPDNVTEWFVQNVPDVTPPLTFALIVGGHSNLTYRVEDASGRAFVLRRPPLGAVLATAHDMGREHKIIAGLAATEVPVPPALGLCEDVSVNEAPFYVMGFVEGYVLTTADQVIEKFDLAQRRSIGESIVDVLAKLHTAKPDDIGLGDLGRKAGFIERQLKRFRTQWESSKTRELPAMEEVYEALQKDVPEQVGCSIVHGDYRLGNMITAHDARIAAVLDWELCTLGDPMADVGYVMNTWAEPEGPARGARATPPTAAPGFPSREAVLARYEEKTGRSTAQVDYYRAFQHWRLAAIVEGVAARYMKGVMGGSSDVELFRRQVEALASSALELIRNRR